MHITTDDDEYTILYLGELHGKLLDKGHFCSVRWKTMRGAAATLLTLLTAS